MECAPLRDQFCRLCLRKYNTLFPLDVKLQDLNLMEIIYMVSGIKMESNPYLPNRVCASCMTKVDCAFNIRLEFQIYVDKLRNLTRYQSLEKYYAEYGPAEDDGEAAGDASRAITKELDAGGVESPTKSCDVMEIISVERAEEARVTAPLQAIEVIIPCDSTTLLPDGNATGQYTADETPSEGNSMEPDSIMDLIEYDDTVTEQQDDYEGQTDVEGLAFDELIVYEGSDDETTGSGGEREQLTADGAEPTIDSDHQIVYNFSWTELMKKQKQREVDAELHMVANNCYMCDMAFDGESKFRAHIESHTSLLPFTCGQCTKEDKPVVLKSVDAMNRHFWRHLLPHNCPHCPRNFRSASSLLSHIRWDHKKRDEAGLTCEYCGLVFDLKRKFSAHIRKHLVKYECDQCQKVVTTKASLLRHQRMHSGEKPYGCPSCHKRFNYSYNLEQHKLLHLDEGGRPFSCDVCRKAFRNSTSLRIHVQQHHSAVQQTYRCNMQGCNFETTHRNRYLYHCGTHQRQYQCGSCEHLFQTAQSLQRHIKCIHKGVKLPKTHQCPYCDKTFYNNSALTAHVDMHMGNLKYSCQYCHKGFLQKGNCAKHELTHNGERPYQCRYCKVPFPDVNTRKRHERTRHTELVATNFEIITQDPDAESLSKTATDNDPLQ